MIYPTLRQVEAADREQICRWWRFLKSPGLIVSPAESDEQRERRHQEEVAVMNRIAERFKGLGGFTPTLSKKIGW